MEMKNRSLLKPLGFIGAVLVLMAATAWAEDGKDQDKAQQGKPISEEIKKDHQKKKEAFEEKWIQQRARECGKLKGQAVEPCNRRLDQAKEIELRREKKNFQYAE